MSKKETIWRHILIESWNEPRFIMQQDIAGKFGYSTSTVFNALKAPRKLGAVEVTGNGFRLRDKEKLLLLWASHRNLEKDTVYRTRVDEPVLGIEGRMPPKVIYAAYSAFRLKYGSAPADYSEVLVYSDQLEEMKRRFPPSKKTPNLFVLKPDPLLETFGPTTPDVQTFVDLWSLSSWYARDFLEALKQKLFPSSP